MDAYDPEQLMSTRRGPRGDVDVKRWLRSLPDDESFAFIVRCLAFRGIYFQEQRALDLAMSCIRRPADALAIFRSGLVNPDASTIKFWLAFAIAKLGGKKVLQEIDPLLESDPITADKALYWLPGLLPENQEAAWALLRAIHQEAKERGVLRGPIVINPPNHESD